MFLSALITSRLFPFVRDRAARQRLRCIFISGAPEAPVSPQCLISLVTPQQAPLAIAVPWTAAFPFPAASHTHIHTQLQTHTHNEG